MALGRGLGELLGEVEVAYGNSNSKNDLSQIGAIVELDVDKIKSNPNQPRKIFDEDKLKELSDSIVEHGLLQPIVVVQDSDGSFTLISGERRLKAHKLAKFEKINSIVLDIEDFKLRELALIENIQRDDLNIIELAYSYAQLINEHNITHDELSKKVFKSRTSITNTLRLLHLSSYVQQLLANSKISAGHAKIMLGLEEAEQKLVADSIIGQKLSVRETEKLVKDLKNPSTKKVQKNKKTTNYDFKPLNDVLKTLKDNKLKVKAEKNYFKIEINSQEDIEKISNYFRNTL
ncbi:chromosome partitioning protein ParB [Malaciobacter molluscorum LMG 25693]|uniref:Chromosome partitioning protein n=1 Tax=Malaciobacter molluscorum LMG 25693 TaxID=870501 RepID=A0A2G1DHQ8_9BACT|nr:ParB/RepB/Spo0J family partition protein [Malaciobacter molluscorum]AXX92976.1 chromosome partitioning protein [Malaciobacter molluscorum LMG 25693]PHO18033.1 chromosome partitioning protein ParB [Malaciobacter molluscorum LMG 25693]RXJ94910.1 chromosome partitioning protein ParB [Malaciobacter molluscorum]